MSDTFGKPSDRNSVLGKQMSAENPAGIDGNLEIRAATPELRAVKPELRAAKLEFRATKLEFRAVKPEFRASNQVLKG